MLVGHHHLTARIRVIIRVDSESRLEFPSREGAINNPSEGGTIIRSVGRIYGLNSIYGQLVFYSGTE